MSNALTLSFQNHSIQQRSDDGYLNGTAMCQAVGKLLGNYLRNEATTTYLNALESDMRIRISELIQVVKGGDSQKQGTWVHPKVAIHLAQWLSPEFAVWCTNVIFNYMNGKNTPASLPPAPKLTPAQMVAIQKQMFLRFPDGPRRAQAYITLKEHFGVARYYEIKESRFDEAIAFIQSAPLCCSPQKAFDQLIEYINTRLMDGYIMSAVHEEAAHLLEIAKTLRGDIRSKLPPEHRREWQTKREAAA